MFDFHGISYRYVDASGDPMPSPYRSYLPGKWTMENRGPGVVFVHEGCGNERATRPTSPSCDCSTCASGPRAKRTKV
jgi:hypothetical protein